MCGRYQFTSEESSALREIIRRVQEKNSGAFRQGEIFPTNAAPVLVRGPQRPEPELVRWGFERPGAGGVVINARAETAPEKAMFRESLRERRCAVPASGFFEWDKEKQKHLFTLPGEDALYMAGIYSPFHGEARFCILTTQANESMRGIHHRMPVVLYQSGVEEWLNSEKAALEVLSSVPPPLESRSVSPQLRLW